MGLNFKAGALSGLLILGAGSVSAKSLSMQEKYLTTKKIQVFDQEKRFLNEVLIQLRQQSQLLFQCSFLELRF